jgi:uncharacterized RDD family membrane protein YckC
LLPVYVWIMLFVGVYTGEGAAQWFVYDTAGWIAMTTAMIVLGGSALLNLLELPFGSTLSQSLFRLAVVDSEGARADRPRLLLRWAIVWLPLLVPLSLMALLIQRNEPTTAVVTGLAVLALWISTAICTVFYPNRGLHDRLAGTWVVRN